MTDRPQWHYRLTVVRLRNNAQSERELARRSGLSHTTVNNLLSGKELHPKRETLANLVFTLTDKPGERESVLVAFDAAVEQAKPRPMPVLDPRTDTQILADAVCDLADAVTKLAEVIERQQPRR